MAELKPPSLAQKLRSIGIGKSHAYMIAQKKRTPSVPLALKIERELGLKLGPIAEADETQINVLRQIHGEAA